MPILIAALSMTISCDFGLTDNDTQSELEKLPPITQTGENTFGCLVNGKAWVPETSVDANAVFQSDFLQISADIEETLRDQNIKLYRHGSIVSGNTYSLTDTLSSANFIWVKEEGICWFERENTLAGDLHITNFDSENYIVSGTFEFTTATLECDTIKVTDGRFDLHYAP